MIKKLEEVSINAWPSLQTNVYDGWIIRFANGYTKRANSINPLYTSEINLEKKINYCETLFKNKGLPIIYKLNQESKPTKLENKLAKKGYEKIGLTSVQVLDLCKVKDIEDSSCIVDTDMNKNWLNVFGELSKIKTEERLALKEMLSNVQRLLNKEFPVPLSLHPNF